MSIICAAYVCGGRQRPDSGSQFVRFHPCGRTRPREASVRRLVVRRASCVLSHHMRSCWLLRPLTRACRTMQLLQMHATLPLWLWVSSSGPRLHSSIELLERKGFPSCTTVGVMSCLVLKSFWIFDHVVTCMTIIV